MTEFLKLDYSAYKNYLLDEKKQQIKTINKKVVVINKYLTYLEHDDLKVKQLREQLHYSLENVPNSSDFGRILRAAKKEDELSYYLALTLAYTGIRVSEIKFFTVENLKDSKAKKYIPIMNKGKYRELTIPKWLRRDLLNYAKEHHIESGHIFLNKYGQLISRQTAWKKIKKITGLAKVSLDKGHPHALRHLFGKELLKYSGDRQFLMNIMGHSNRKTSEIYTQQSREEIADQMDHFRI